MSKKVMSGKYFRNLILVIILIFPLVCWSGIGDSYQCQDEIGELGGEGPEEGFFFVFKWNSNNIKGSYFDSPINIDHKILFQNHYEFISTKYYKEGRITWTFNDYDLDGKGFLLRSYLKGDYHFVTKSECSKVVL